MAAEDAGGSGDLAILVNTEMIILKGAVKAAASAGSVTGKVVNKALLSPFRLIQFCMKLHKQHIVFNSVSLVDGVKYHYSDGQWKSNIQPITDQLCEKYGLKKLTYVPGKRKGVDYGTWREKKDPSGSQRLREAIDMAIAQSDSYDDFLSIMRKSYQVKIGFSQKWNSEYLSFKDFKTPAGR